MSCLLMLIYESRGLLDRQGPSLVTCMFAGDAMPGASGCVTPRLRTPITSIQGRDSQKSKML